RTVDRPSGIDCSSPTIAQDTITDAGRAVRAGRYPLIGSQRYVCGCPASSRQHTGFSGTAPNLALLVKTIDGRPEDCPAPNGTLIGTRSVREPRQVETDGYERFPFAVGPVIASRSSLARNPITIR